MSSYLEIAEQVLRNVRRPLTPKSILSEAFKADMVPAHLYGQTQHKTLQARLSEDILYLKSRSRFFRTEPGKFFLREFLSDDAIPEEFKRPIKARRRTRELSTGPVLCVHHDVASNLNAIINKNGLHIIEDLFKNGYINYFDLKTIPSYYMIIWSFSMLINNNSVLSYRLGRYRVNDYDFSSKRTLGFSSLISDHDRTLFNMDSYGLFESAVTALSIDLDLPLSRDGIDIGGLHLQGFEIVSNHSGRKDAIAIFEAKCPQWFHPMIRRLSINDLRWMPFNVPPNSVEDFDPWSRAVIDRRFTSRDSRECPAVDGTLKIR